MKKVICINIDHYAYITMNKEYDVISEDEIYYKLKNDETNILSRAYKKVDFIISRNEKLKRILDD